MVIEDLKKHPDLLVKETDNLNITVILLASLTAELKERLVAVVSIYIINSIIVLYTFINFSLSQPWHWH
jgi:hypothetical protein